MSNLINSVLKTAVAAALLGAMSLASAASGTSGSSGSAGAGIDTGGGGSAAGSGASSNPKLAEGSGGPVGLLEKVFGDTDPSKKKKKRGAN
ncbi:MAG: hypothetical protein JWQ90_124 [Hydrocarboniphaga sp.]|uniref:hypothetical protein n=1 Tax=Hydrocarboniphaga sp. TaxID=2033016 RepID=UPI002635D3E1|nr:hypothetical protein [Hydrocarboniphaga sp.]MDB5967674.1 hypothetical protein [Hydrocarboniphaga sp.]